MPRHGAWRKWSGILATATERDFERKVLPFLRLFWQFLQQLPARGPWDAKGIDLLVWADSGPFPCGVQCKGFQVQELGDDQIRQVIKSIKAFRESDAVCDTYLLIHNRDGKIENSMIQLTNICASLFPMVKLIKLNSGIVKLFLTEHLIELKTF